MMSIFKLQWYYLVVALICFGCNQPKNSEKNFPVISKPNVIVFIADDVSWNDLGCYGNTFVQTPNIDKLSTEGVQFNQAILTASSCSPSRISIMTGRYPHNTGAAELHTEPTIEFESIASSLKANGYYTGSAGKWHMGDLLKSGFDKIYEKLEENGDGGENMWLPSLKERDKNKPFFFWFAAYDAHRLWGENPYSNTHNPEDINVPVTLVDTDSTRLDLGQYYDEIKRFDVSIGKVVAELKEQNVLDNTVIIVMADNGRPFPRDKTRMYDSGMKTPFIVYWPKKIKEAITTNSLISSIDMAPTILDICNTDIPVTFQGKSFKSVLFDANATIRKYAFAEHNWHDHEAHERMVRSVDYMYILNSRPAFPNQGPADALNGASFKDLLKAKNEGSLTAAQSDIFMVPRPSEELYNCAEDGLQMDNLIGNAGYNSIHTELSNILKEWIKRTGDDVPQQITKDWYTRETGEKIEENFGIRGTMPGSQSNASLLNESHD